MILDWEVIRAPGEGGGLHNMVSKKEYICRQQIENKLWRRDKVLILCVRTVCKCATDSRKLGRRKIRTNCVLEEEESMWIS
jgi:hypothetical protein